MKKLFEGAGLVISDSLKNYTNDKNDIVVETKYAEELSNIIFFLKKLYEGKLDYFNKYTFYGQMGEYYKKLILENGDIESNIIRFIIKFASDRIYYAYGSNMDEKQMKESCKDSILISKGKLKNYRFVLDSKGYASIEENKRSSVEGLLWLITEDDEKRLDYYEGVSSNCYRKEKINVENNGLIVSALTYISNRDIENIIKNKQYFDKVISAAKKHGIKIEFKQEIAEVT